MTCLLFLRRDRLLRESDRVAIARQRHQREIERVEMILQIEHLRKTRPRKWLLVPGAIDLLRPRQPIDAGANDLALLLPRRQQSEQRPGGLGGSRRSL